jgi:PadR family transcriptional regulator PadR
MLQQSNCTTPPRPAPVDFPQEDHVTSCWLSTRGTKMAPTKNEILPGTLNLMVLKTLHTIGPLHGYGIARRIEQISGDVVQLNQGTIYPALLQLEQMGWIKSKWGASENNRKAKYYSITRRGLKQLTEEEESWRRTSEVMLRFLATAEEK